MYLNRRNPNTTTSGGGFSAATVQAVWEKGVSVPGYDANVLKKDICGAWMKRSEYGNTSSKYGWEIDHKKPVAKDGVDELSNLQPLQWANNRHKSDDWPQWSCKVKAA